MMSTKKYRIRLTTDEQQELNALVSRGRAAAYKQTHARLMSDESRSDGGMKDADITSALGVGQSTVEGIRVPRVPPYVANGVAGSAGKPAASVPFPRHLGVLVVMAPSRSRPLVRPLPRRPFVPWLLPGSSAD